MTQILTGHVKPIFKRSGNVWCRLIGGKLIVPFFYNGTLSGRRYLNFLIDELPRLLEDVSLEKRERMFFSKMEHQITMQLLLHDNEIKYFRTAGLVLMASFLGLHDPQI
jgi:hypothetical protein